MCGRNHRLFGTESCLKVATCCIDELTLQDSRLAIIDAQVHMADLEPVITFCLGSAALHSLDVRLRQLSQGQTWQGLHSLRQRSKELQDLPTLQIKKLWCRNWVSPQSIFVFRFFETLSLLSKFDLAIFR